jgi:hypothetical protein
MSSSNKYDKSSERSQGVFRFMMVGTKTKREITIHERIATDELVFGLLSRIAIDVIYPFETVDKIILAVNNEILDDYVYADPFNSLAAIKRFNPTRVYVTVDDHREGGGGARSLTRGFTPIFL